MTRHKRVLIVEDDAPTAAFLLASLRAEGFAAVAVGDGISALKAVAHDRPDAVVLDLSLPRMNGLSILGSLRANPRTRTLPVIVVSGHTDRETEWAAREAGCQEYLRKPVSAGRISGTVDRIIREARCPWDSPRDGRGRWVGHASHT